MPQFLDFDNARIVSQKVEDYFNSPQSDQDIIFLAKKFNLQIKEDFLVHTSEVRRNCPECMGCKNDSCILGCFDSDTDVVCLWDLALEEIIGTKLILHEYGHVIYDQIFIDDLDEDDSFEQSEAFAQFVEDNFTISLEFCEGCSDTEIKAKVMRKGFKLNQLHLPGVEDVTGMTGTEMRSEAFRGIIAGLSLALGAAIFAVALNAVFGQDRARIVG